MSFTYKLLGIAAAILIINLPFGYWRASVRKYSWQWVAAIHLPVLLAIALRLYEHIAFRLAMLPLFVAMFFIGQLLGGKIKTLKK